MIDKKTQVFTDNDAGKKKVRKKLCQIKRINEAFPINRDDKTKQV
jgi:hypothetical protein